MKINKNSLSDIAVGQLFHSRALAVWLFTTTLSSRDQSILSDRGRVAFSLLRKIETLKIILFDSCQLLSYFVLLVSSCVANVPGDGIHQNMQFSPF